MGVCVSGAGLTASYWYSYFLFFFECRLQGIIRLSINRDGRHQCIAPKYLHSDHVWSWPRPVQPQEMLLWRWPCREFKWRGSQTRCECVSTELLVPHVLCERHPPQRVFTASLGYSDLRLMELFALFRTNSHAHTLKRPPHECGNCQPSSKTPLGIHSQYPPVCI